MHDDIGCCFGLLHPPSKVVAGGDTSGSGTSGTWYLVPVPGTRYQVPVDYQVR